MCGGSWVHGLGFEGSSCKQTQNPLKDHYSTGLGRVLGIRKKLSLKGHGYG